MRLHVAAKRYLCGKEADYFAKLSFDSILSLALQNGPMTADEIAELEFLSYWQDAVKLRRYDEDAKIKGLIHEHGGFYALSGALHGCVILHPV